MSTAAVLPLGANETIAGAINTPGEVDEFQVTLADSGRLTVEVQTRPGCSLDTRTSLLGSDDQLLIQSDGQSLINRDDLIVQHLLAGTYFVKVEGLRGGTGDYTLSTEFEPATPPNQPVLADYPTNYPFALSPRFGAVGDFNRDGRLDVVTADVNTGDVSLFLGLGDGTFQAARNLAVGALPIAVAVGDFDGDGKLDMAVANQGSGDVSVLLGQGDGTFAPERRVSGGHGASFVTAGDVNGDGKLDLAIGSLSTDDVAVLLGNGDGTFQPEILADAGGNVPARLALGDFNGDGHLDIAVDNFTSNKVSILLGQGDGAFQLEKDNPLGITHLDAPFGIVAGDFNHDGHLDLAITNSGSGNVSQNSGHAGDATNFTEANPGSEHLSENVAIFLGNGDGTFRSAGQYATGTTPFIVTAGDFNGDGNLDLAITNRQSNDVSVLLGKGDGTFQEQRRYRAGLQPWGIMAADFNGDGHLDLAAVNIRSHDVSILLGLGDGTFQPDLTDPRHGGTNPLGIATGDFNRDGIPDLAAVSYTGGDVFVYQGRGDGTFGNRVRYGVGSTPAQIVAADFNGDGLLDLATANCNSADLSVLLGRGDGTFQPELRSPSSTSGEYIVTGDVNGDGKLDLITGGQFGAGIALVLGNGDGTFQKPKIFGLGYATAGAAVGDFNGDGKLDVAVTDLFSPDHDVLIFLGNGDGTFQEPPLQVPVGLGPLGILAGDFNHDGKTDLAVTNFGVAGKKAVQGAGGAGAANNFAPGSVSILLGNGDGTFRTGDLLVTGPGPDSIVAGDFNGDGKFDLAVTNSLDTNVSVFMGRGDGTFQTALSFPVGDEPTPRRGLITGDFNRDGKTDLAATELLSNDVSVLFGSGDGAFASPLRFGVGLGPVALATGDFNNDGRLDVAGVNPTNNEVSVSLGRGDTTLEDPAHFPVGPGPVAVVRGDFNRDGRADLATANFASNDVSVLLGLGDGTFQQAPRVLVGKNPTSLVTADFNGDGIPDLAVANAGSNDVSILLGRGRGAFQDQTRLAAGDLPQALVAGDFNGDGIPDLAVANYRSQDVWVYLGRGGGKFRDPLRLPLGESPVALVAGDFNRDGRLDLAVADYRSGDVAVLLGRGDGTFRVPVRFAAGTNPVYLVAGDFNKDGIPDLAAADNTSSAISLLLGRGDGTFGAPVRQEAGDSLGALLADDFNSDGRIDLALTGQSFGNVSVLQGMGNSTFIPGGALSSPLHATPLIGDWNGDRLPDVAVVNRDGEILLRSSRPGTPGVFEAPVIVNPAPLPPARDLAVVSTPRGQRLAALNARSPSLSFYARQPDGTFTGSAGPKIPGLLPVALAAGDLNGDGRTDLAVAEASGKVFVYLQNAAGGFGPAPDYTLGVGLSPSALELVDVDGDKRLDIVVTNRYSGDISVLSNDPQAPFTSELRFRAGTGLYSLNRSTGALAVSSRQAPAGLVAGRFDSRDPIDLIVTDSGANRFSLLRGDGSGGFLNPESAPAFATGPDPTVAVADRFTAGPDLDLAILNEENGDISIFLGDGQGGFPRTSTVNAGNLPTGLAVADINGDHKLDLLVGNDYGDLLILPGNGDGTFQPYQRANRNIALAVTDINGDGRPDFIFGNEGLDRVSVQYSQPGQRFVQDRNDGLLAPGAVTTADLNHDGLPDLLVTNSGANNVLVYLGTGGGQFGPARSFFAGTNPVGITVRDLNADGLPDLVVANQGSNDVTVLLGEETGSDWTLAPGPRLRAGTGPVSAAVQDVTGDGVPDLLVSNSQSNNVLLLPGVGGGFFNDQAPRSFATGASPRQVFVGDFDARPGLDLVALDAGSNSLTFFSDFTSPNSVAINLASGGLTPVAALAGDFNGDGLEDLVVANNGDGAISLFLGREGGLSLEAIHFLADFPHPTALALAGEAGRELDVYVAGESTEAARFLSFSDLGPIPLATSESLGFAGSGQGQVADLLPLQDTTLATVAVLLTVRLESEALPAQREQEGGLAGGREAEPHEFVRLLLDRLGEQARGTEAGGTLDLEAPAGPPVDRDALLELVTGREETRAVRPALTREEVLNTAKPAPPAPDMPPVSQLLDEWMPGSTKALDTFWQAVADGSLRLGETAAALGPAIAPVRAAMRLLPDLPLREVVDSVTEGVLEAVRSAADAAGARLAPASEGTPPSPEGAKLRQGETPAEPPALEEKDLRLSPPSEQSRSELPQNPPAGEAAVAASLVATLFGAGWYRVLRKPSIEEDCGKRARSRRDQKSGR